MASLHRSEAPTRGAAPTATAGEAASHVPVQTLSLRIHRRVRTGRPLPVASLHRREAPTRGAAPTATAGEAASHAPAPSPASSALNSVSHLRARASQLEGFQQCRPYRAGCPDHYCASILTRLD